MDDTSTLIETAITQCRYKRAILIAVENGWHGLAPVLATSYEAVLSVRDRIDIVCAFFRADETRTAIDLSAHWRISELIPQGINEHFDLAIMARDKRRGPS